MRKAFICATPYQILVAINMKYTEQIDGDIDLYILNHFNNSEEIAKKLKQVNCFNEVIHINCLEFSNSFLGKKRSNFIRKTIAFFKSKKIVSNYVDPNNLNYDYV